MPENVEKIKVLGKEIILIGTAHISKKSVDLVKETIENEKPSVVCVELCQSRYHSIFNKESWENEKITDVIKSGKSWLFLSSIIVSSFQRKLGNSVDVSPGAEMIEAINTAGQNNIPFELIDRDVQVTLKRIWGLISLKEKASLAGGIVAGLFELDDEKIDTEFIEKLKESDMLSEVIGELSKHAPTIKKVLIDERDAYMAERLMSLPHEKIVAVVGAGHIKGIKSILNRAKKSKKIIKASRKILEVPESGFYGKAFAYLIPVIFIGIIAYGFWIGGYSMTFEIIKKWFLITGLFAALGAIISLSHPLTVLSAFIAAPFTTLHPFLAAGWVAGLVEAKLREPKVKDFYNLKKIDSVGAFWNNNVSRILLVVFLVNITASIGTFVALPYLAMLFR